MMQQWSNIFWVALGGMLGSVARYLAGISIRSQQFPYSTLFVNVVGSFLIGALYAFFLKKQNASNDSLWLFWITGVCGGFTTFSALSLENFQLVQTQRWGALILYICATILLGLTATLAGYRLFR